jgi:hypothetical protein
MAEPLRCKRQLVPRSHCQDMRRALFVTLSGDQALLCSKILDCFRVDDVDWTIDHCYIQDRR